MPVTYRITGNLLNNKKFEKSYGRMYYIIKNDSIGIRRSINQALIETTSIQIKFQ